MSIEGRMENGEDNKKRGEVRMKRMNDECTAGRASEWLNESKQSHPSWRIIVIMEAFFCLSSTRTNIYGIVLLRYGYHQRTQSQ